MHPSYDINLYLLSWATEALQMCSYTVAKKKKKSLKQQELFNMLLLWSSILKTLDKLWCFT